MKHFFGFCLGMLILYLCDLWVAIIGTPVFDLENCHEYLETENPDEFVTVAACQDEPIVTTGEGGSTVEWKWKSR